MGKAKLQAYFLQRMRMAVDHACEEDKEALQELLEIAEENISKLTEDDIFRLLRDLDRSEPWNTHD